MVDSTVTLDYDAFFQAFLSPPHINFRPKRTLFEPFAPLGRARKLSEDSLAEHFITAVRAHHLTPKSTLTTLPFQPLSKGQEAEPRDHTAIYRSTDVPRRGLPHWADQKVPFQFSPYATGIDPFAPTRVVWGMNYTETEQHLECETLRKRIYATAELLFAAQHRVFLFMVLVIGSRFRLLRWDRAGVIVTPSVDYVENSALLCDCLRRLSLLDDISLGFDPTATRLRPHDPDFLRIDAAALDGPHDVDHAERRIEEGEIGDAFVFGYVRSLFRDSLSTDWPRYRLRVQDCGNTRNFLVGKPLHLPSRVVGRGTRGYVALDCDTERFVWLKDAWRRRDLNTELEGNILRKLNSADVANVPTLVCHGDVLDQKTITDEWWGITHGIIPWDPSERWTSGNRKRKRDETTGGGGSSAPDGIRKSPPAMTRRYSPLNQHTHYRIVVEEVALPLTKFRNGKQLVSLVLDCLHAHHQAATYNKCGLLHRDISTGNMLIYPRVRPGEDGKSQSIVWTGILADWELAKPVDAGRSLQAHRVGTHRFMSVNLLSDPFCAVTICDELESFFHALVYFSVRYLRSNCPSPTSWINSYFLASGMPDMYLGGMKTAMVQDEGCLTMLLPPGPLLFKSPMDKVLSGLIKSFTAHYKVMAHELAQSRSPSWSSNSAASSPDSDADKTNSTQVAPAARPKVLVVLPSFSDDPELTAALAARKTYKPPDMTPSAEEQERARRVADHEFALDFIARSLRHKGWPDDDRIPAPPVPTSDSRPEPEPEPEPQVASGDADAEPAPKRQRKAASKAKTTGARSRTQTAPRPPTAPRTRNQTRVVTRSKSRPGRGGP